MVVSMLMGVAVTVLMLVLVGVTVLMLVLVGVAVLVLVLMGVAVLMLMLMGVAVTVLMLMVVFLSPMVVPAAFAVMIPGVRAPFVNGEMDSFDTFALGSIKVHVKIAEIDFRQLPLERGRFDAQVHQSANGHVAADP
jgi:hypothetical protein